MVARTTALINTPNEERLTKNKRVMPNIDTTYQVLRSLLDVFAKNVYQPGTIASLLDSPPQTPSSTSISSLSSPKHASGWDDLQQPCAKKPSPLHYATLITAATSFPRPIVTPEEKAHNKKREAGSAQEASFALRFSHTEVTLNSTLPFIDATSPNLTRTRDHRRRYTTSTAGQTISWCI